MLLGCSGAAPGDTPGGVLATYRETHEGRVRERGKGSWELRVYLGRDPVTGRDRYKTKTFALVVEAGAGVASDGTFGALVEQWFTIASISKDWSPSTIVETRRIINTKLRPLLAMPLDKVRTSVLDAFYANLRTRGGSQLRRSTGLDPEIHPHSLRHSVVTLGAGVALPQVAGRVGHGGGGHTTLAVYSHFQQARDQEVADLLARILERPAGQEPVTAILSDQQVPVPAARSVQLGSQYLELIGLRDETW